MSKLRPCCTALIDSLFEIPEMERELRALHEPDADPEGSFQLTLAGVLEADAVITGAKRTEAQFDKLEAAVRYTVRQEMTLEVLCKLGLISRKEPTP